jgi:hypothetical protein
LTRDRLALRNTEEMAERARVRLHKANGPTVARVEQAHIARCEKFLVEQRERIADKERRIKRLTKWWQT